MSERATFPCSPNLLERVDRKNRRRFTPAALAWLGGRRYAGNIRELRNLIERATLLADGEFIDVPHLTELAETRRRAEVAPVAVFRSVTVPYAGAALSGLRSGRVRIWMRDHPGGSTRR